MQWMLVRSLVGCLMVVPLLEKFHTSASAADVFRTFLVLGKLEQVGVIVALVLLMSAVLELVKCIVRVGRG
jgi:hypothetical protein